ncbi:PD-(D/E)XK nuclease family protein [Acidobacteriota bacterium]
MKNLLNVLGRFCSDHLLDEKIFIVPSYQTGHQIGEALAKSGASWINLQFVTLPSLAVEIAGLELSSKGLQQISGTAASVLINHIFRELKEDRAFVYYKNLEPQAGIIDAISRSVRDLRAAGIKSTDLKEDQFIDKDKGRETQIILKKYEEELEAGKFFDTVLLYKTASEIVKRGPSNSERFYLCLQDQIFSKIERDFLDSLTEDLFLVPHGRVVGMDRPERMIKIGEEESESLVPQTNLERAPWLFTMKNAPAPFNDNTLEMFHAIGPTNECKEVLRRIIAEKIPFDQVEIIHPGGAVYPSIFYVLSEKKEFLFSSSEGLPLSFSVPGKVFSGIIDWMENDYPVLDLSRLLESGYLKTPKDEEGKTLSSLKVSRTLKRAKIGWGRDRYGHRLDVLYRETKAKTKDETERLKEIYKIKGWIKSVLDLFPVWEEEKIDIGDLCAGISSFLKKFCRVRDSRDGNALGKITSRLDEASSFKDISFTKDEAVEWLKSNVSGLRIGNAGPLSGHLFLSSYREGGYSGRKFSFIVGLDQGAVPGSRLPDPILLDEEREAISKDLTSTSDRLRENLYAMTGLLSSLGGQVVLSFPSYDVIEERPSFPSSFLLQVYRLIEGNVELDYSALMNYLGGSSGFVGEKKLDETDWWLDFIAGDGPFKDAINSVKDLYPFISHGDFARVKKAGPDLSTYDGLVMISESEFNPLRNSALSMSASRIEKLARCPYGYFLRYVLAVSPPDEILIDKAAWLDAMERGSLIHDVLYEFMKGLREKGETLGEKDFGEEIRRVAVDVMRTYREENPPPSEAVFEREKGEIFGALDIFLKAEEKREEKVEPLLFEVNFGIKGEVGEGIEESVTVELGPGLSFRLKGKIDRVDRQGRSSYRVIDYKTGSYKSYENIKAFGKGKCLQHALYAEAAEKILKEKKIDGAARVTVTGYSFPTGRGDGREILIENFDRVRLKELLIHLFSILEKGYFLVNPKASCDFCDYGIVCGKGVIDRTKEKIETNAEQFEVFDRLEEFE